MTDRTFVRGDAEVGGHLTPDGRNPRLSEVRGNPWAVGELIVQEGIAGFMWRTGAEMAAVAHPTDPNATDWGHIVARWPQGWMDQLPWFNVEPEAPATDPITATPLPYRIEAEAMALDGFGTGDGPGFGPGTRPGDTGAGCIVWWNHAGQRCKDRLAAAADSQMFFKIRYQNGEPGSSKRVLTFTDRSGLHPAWTWEVDLPTTGGWVNAWYRRTKAILVPRGDWDFTVDAADTPADVDHFEFTKTGTEGHYADPGEVTPPPPDAPPPPPPPTATPWDQWAVRTDYGGHDQGPGSSIATVTADPGGDILTLAVTHDAAGGDRRVSVDYPDGKLDTRVEVEVRYPELPAPGATQATSIYINRSGDDSDYSGGYGPHGVSMSLQPDRDKLVMGRRSGFDAHDGLAPYDEQSGSTPFTYQEGIWYKAVIQRLDGWVRQWFGEGDQPLNPDGSPKAWSVQAPATWVDQPGSVQLWNHDGPGAPQRTTRVQFRNLKILDPVGGPVTQPPPVVTPPPTSGDGWPWPKMIGLDALEPGEIAGAVAAGLYCNRLEIQGPTWEWVGHNRWPSCRAALDEHKAAGSLPLVTFVEYPNGPIDGTEVGQRVCAWIQKYIIDLGYPQCPLEVGNETWGGNDGWYWAPAELAKAVAIVRDFVKAKGLTKIRVGMSRQPFNQPGYQTQTDNVLGGVQAVVDAGIFFNAPHCYGRGVLTTGNWGAAMAERSYEQTPIPTYDTESGWPTNGDALGAGPAGGEKVPWTRDKIRWIMSKPWHKGWSVFAAHGWGAPDDWDESPAQVAQASQQAGVTWERPQ